MSEQTIHILLLDARVISVKTKNHSVKFIIRHICKYLDIHKWDTTGLLYEDVRGFRQWLDESKSLLDHDIIKIGEVLQLVFKIRYIPHHVCDHSSNIYQLFLTGVRLLKQNWFISNSEIHSQLIALYILSVNNGDFNRVIVQNALNSDSFLTTNDDASISNIEDILAACNIYASRYNSTHDFVFKFLHLLMNIPTFTSNLFVVKRSENGDKVLFGINSKNVTIFRLNELEDPLEKFKVENISGVNSRRLKIVLTLRENRSRSDLTNGLLDNDVRVFYALSDHQCNIICSQLKHCINFNKMNPDVIPIRKLFRMVNFKNQFDDWFYGIRYRQNVPNTYKNEDRTIQFNVVYDAEINPSDIEEQFGEVDIVNSSLYFMLLNAGRDEELTYEKLSLEDCINEKLNELYSNFVEEQSITNEVNAEFFLYFPKPTSKFQKNGKAYSLSPFVLKNSALTSRIKSHRLSDNKTSRFYGSVNEDQRSSNHSVGSIRSVSDLRNNSIQSLNNAMQSPKSVDRYCGFKNRTMVSTLKSSSKWHGSCSDITYGRQFQSFTSPSEYQKAVINRNGNRSRSIVNTLKSQRNHAGSYTNLAVNKAPSITVSVQETPSGSKGNLNSSYQKPLKSTASSPYSSSLRNSRSSYNSESDGQTFD